MMRFSSLLRHVPLLVALAACSRNSPPAEMPGADSNTMNMPGSDGMSGMPNMHDAHEMAHMKHMKLTSSRRPTHADSLRADSVLTTLRGTLARYTDVASAEADGFKHFAPGIKNQRILHYSNKANAMRAAFGFDASRPTSLLYTAQRDGSLKLIGAMYTAPKNASEDELNARIPLSMTHWHQHINICLPNGDISRWNETENGVPLFGPAGSISTEADCSAHNGRLRPQVFGWMVHVNALESDPAKVWPGMRD